jgi:hypothetical protein
MPAQTLVKAEGIVGMDYDLNAPQPDFKALPAAFIKVPGVRAE